MIVTLGMAKQISDTWCSMGYQKELKKSVTGSWGVTPLTFVSHLDCLIFFPFLFHGLKIFSALYKIQYMQYTHFSHAALICVTLPLPFSVTGVTLDLVVNLIAQMQTRRVVHYTL